jgi:hypothetical protein
VTGPIAGRKALGGASAVLSNPSDVKGAQEKASARLGSGM